VTLAPVGRSTFAGRQPDSDTATTILFPKPVRHFHSGWAVGWRIAPTNVLSCLGCATDWQQETRGLFLWSRVGDTPLGLSAPSCIERSKLKALPASAPEVLVYGDRQMSALPADKSPVCDGSHWLKLVTQDAVRAPNYGHGHRYSTGTPVSR